MRVKIARKQDIPLGQMKGFSVENRQVLVANVAGRYYAMDAVCSHMHGYLPAGTLRNHIVICPVHHARYDVTTGRVLKNVNGLLRMVTGGGASDLMVYPVTVAGDDITIEVGEN